MYGYVNVTSHTSPQGDQGSGAKSRLGYLGQSYIKGFKTTILRLGFQPYQVRDILFQGHSRNCLVIILYFLWKDYHPVSGDSVAVLRSRLSSSSAPSVVMEMDGSEICSQMMNHLLPLLYLLQAKA